MFSYSILNIIIMTISLFEGRWLGIISIVMSVIIITGCILQFRYKPITAKDTELEQLKKELNELENKSEPIITGDPELKLLRKEWELEQLEKK